jgi:lipopolysaccharide/colanic/teichoic acid biosynthesis glycosyltransferase
MLMTVSELNLTAADFAPHPPRAQRLLDLLIALPAAALLAPLLAAIALLVKLDSPGPALFRQQRVGRFGRLFDILKFRTMVVNAEHVGAQITIGRDPRITRVGHFLRRHKLDELPQLLNILKGDMSLVGPRPEVPRYVALYNADQRRILAIRPGLTSPASIAFHNESELLAAHSDPEEFYRNQAMPAKIALDLHYARHATVWSDCAILARTFLRILR